MNRPARTQSAAPAFSLIELIMVMLIAAIIAAMAVPRYGEALNRYRADAAARRIASDLALAQSKARSLSTSRSVAFNMAANSYQLPGEADLNKPSATYTVNLASEPYFVSIGSVNFGGGGTVTFNGYGVPSSAGFVQIRAGAVNRRISLDADTGVATVQ